MSFGKSRLGPLKQLSSTTASTGTGTSKSSLGPISTKSNNNKSISSPIKSPNNKSINNNKSNSNTYKSTTTANNNNSNNSTNNSTNNSYSARLKPIRLALQYNPPCIGLEYADLKYDSKLRYKRFPIDLPIVLPSNSTVSTELIANNIVNQLIATNSHYLIPELGISNKQLNTLILKLIKYKQQQQQQQSNPANTSNNQLFSLDLNRASDSTIAAAKAAMSVDFKANLLKPGDVGYVYDKRIEFEEGTEPSDWD